MWRFGLKQVGRFALGLLGAVLLSAFVAAFSSQSDASGFARAFLAHLLAMARLDFGTSILSGRGAAEELTRRLPATLELVGSGALIALALGIPLGILLNAGRSLRAGAPLIQLVSAVPVFCAALGLLWLSDQVLHWDGALTGAPLYAAFVQGAVSKIELALKALALPALTVGVAGIASVQLVLRRAIAEAAVQPYRSRLQSLGLGRLEIDWFYLVPEIAAGLLKNAGEIASSLLAATVVAEWVFDWPGAADLFLKSVALQDWTVAALVLLVFAALTLAAELSGRIAAQAVAAIEAGA